MLFDSTDPDPTAPRAVEVSLDPVVPPKKPLPSPTTYRGLLFRMNTRWHRTALFTLTGAAFAWWLFQLSRGLGCPWVDDSALAMLSFPLVLEFPELAGYVVAFLLLVGLWILRTGFRGRAERLWMAAFWVQFVDHLEYAVRAGIAIVDRGLATDLTPVGMLEYVFHNSYTHVLLATVVASLSAAAIYRHIHASPEEAVDHNCGCAARHAEHPAGSPRARSI